MSQPVFNQSRETELDGARTGFLLLVAILLGLGVLMVYSSSMRSRDLDLEQKLLAKHLVFLSGGIAAAWVVSRISVRQWKQLAPWAYAGTLVLLLLVLSPGLGHRVNGAQRWFKLGAISFQPSEVAKLTLPLFLCYLQTVRLRRPISLMEVVAAVVPMLMLIVIEPDLGSTVFLLCSTGMTLWFLGWPLRSFAIVGLLGLLAPVGLLFLKPYQRARITGFMDAIHDWREAPYQVKQSLVTLGSGEIWGTGLGKGIQKLSFLPEANNDFVFAVVGEEMGVLGTVGILLVWGGVLLTGSALLARVRQDRFAYAWGMTLLAQLTLQAMLNIAVVTAMIPPKGIPHPFMSYGGSNLIVSLLAIGLIVGLSERRSEIRRIEKPVLPVDEV